MSNIVIHIGSEEFKARLTEGLSPNTVRKILEALPIKSVAMKWGDEIYFEIPVDMPAENAQAVVRRGDLGYWPDGSCFCIFYGRTPMSRSEDEIVAASPVNVIGTIENFQALKKHSAGEQVVISRAQ